MKVKIHPALRIEANIAITIGVIVLFAGGLLLLWALLLFGISMGLISRLVPPGSIPPLVGWFVIGTCLLAGFVLVCLGRHLVVIFPGWLRRASWLLAFTQPRKMCLKFESAAHIPGKYVELFEEGKGEATLPDQCVEIRSPELKIRDLEPGPVDIFSEPQPDGVVVIVTTIDVLWGFRQERAFVASQERS